MRYLQPQQEALSLQLCPRRCSLSQGIRATAFQSPCKEYCGRMGKSTPVPYRKIAPAVIIWICVALLLCRMYGYVEGCNPATAHAEQFSDSDPSPALILCLQEAIGLESMKQLRHTGSLQSRCFTNSLRPAFGCQVSELAHHVARAFSSHAPVCTWLPVVIPIQKSPTLKEKI